MNLEKAINACRNGAIAAFISAGLTLFVVAFATLRHAQGNLAL